MRKVIRTILSPHPGLYLACKNYDPYQPMSAQVFSFAKNIKKAKTMSGGEAEDYLKRNNQNSNLEIVSLSE